MTNLSLLLKYFFVFTNYLPFPNWYFLNPIQDRPFRGCLRMEGGGKNAPVPMICHIYPTMMKLGTLIVYIKKIHVTQLLSSVDISIFSLKVSIHNFSIHNWYIISNCFNFFWIFKDFFSRHGYNFNDVSKNGYSRPC